MATNSVSGPIHRIHAGFYQVEGANGRNYTVNPIDGICTCPDTHFRGNHNCKHLRAVRELIAAETETPLAAAARKARTLTETELYHHAAQRNGTAAGCACLLELAARKRAEDEDAELRRIFS